MQAKLEKVRESTDALDRWLVGICFDEFSNSVWTTENEGPLRRWTPDLELKEMSPGLQAILREHDGLGEWKLSNLRDVSAIRKGLLIADCGHDRVVLVKKGGKEKPITYSQGRTFDYPDAIIPISGTEAFIMWGNSGGRDVLYRTPMHPGSTLMGTCILNAKEGDVKDASLGKDQRLYFVVQAYGASRPLGYFVYAGENPRRADDCKRTFEVRANSDVDAIAVHPSGNLVLASLDGYVHYYDTSGNRLARPFDSGLGEKGSCALAINKQGRVYLAAAESPILELKVQE